MSHLGLIQARMKKKAEAGESRHMAYGEHMLSVAILMFA